MAMHCFSHTSRCAFFSCRREKQWLFSLLFGIGNNNFVIVPSGLINRAILHSVPRSHGLIQQVDINQRKEKRQKDKWNNGLAGPLLPVKETHR